MSVSGYSLRICKQGVRMEPKLFFRRVKWFINRNLGLNQRIFDANNSKLATATAKGQELWM